VDGNTPLPSQLKEEYILGATVKTVNSGTEMHLIWTFPENLNSLRKMESKWPWFQQAILIQAASVRVHQPESSCGAAMQIVGWWSRKMRISSFRV